MKKCFMCFLALLLGVGMLNANPVDVNKAKMIGQQFAQTSLETSSAALDLVYAPLSDRGTTSFYVFNIGQEGYVVVSGDDYYRPIVGYSKSHTFDPTDPGLAYMLRSIQAGRNKRTGKPTVDVAAEWELVANEGRLMSKNGGRMVDFLCQTKWNQNYPFNALCPNWNGGPGGHFYAGCVATAMAQVMKFWNHPLQGQGSHSYTSQTLHLQGSANFGATTYDWDNMPNTLNSSSPQNQINAVATLIYHCAVAVDMNWEYDGSGSNNQLASQRMAQYFRYTSAATYQRRANFSATVWDQKVRESLDLGWPMLYSGTEEDAPYGHSFVLDGYNDEGLFHFNFGWSGSGDDWYDWTTMDYHVGDGAVFNLAPEDVYNNTAQAPTNLTVTPAGNNELSATLTWTNPSKTLNNSNLSGIDHIVIMRNDEVVAMLDNATPGAQMSYVDNEVPRFDHFTYHVYAVCSGSHGKTVHSNVVGFGPTCNWTIMMTSSHAQGWRGGGIDIYNAAGTLVGSCTTNSSSPSSASLTIPIGRVSFVWRAPSEEITTMNIILKDSQNSTVFTFSGSSNDLPEGVIFEANNGCGNALGTGVPSNLVAVRDENNTSDIHVSWDGVDEEGYGYNVYRDGLLNHTVLEGTSFVDHNAPMGGHCYYVVFLSMGGENPGQSNESCANAGDGCYPPTNFTYETTEQHKVKLLWERPEPSDGLSGYYIYRKGEGDDDYRKIKTSGSSATNYTDNTLNQEGNYKYKIVAYYHSIECLSAPASWIGDDNQFYIDVYFDPTGLGESVAHNVSLFPNPTKHSFTIEGDDLQEVMVYNMVGQLVHQARCEGNNAVVDLGNVESGVYMVRVITAKGETTKKLSVIR